MHPVILELYIYIFFLLKPTKMFIYHLLKQTYSLLLIYFFKQFIIIDKVIILSLFLMQLFANRYFLLNQTNEVQVEATQLRLLQWAVGLQVQIVYPPCLPTVSQLKNRTHKKMCQAKFLQFGREVKAVPQTALLQKIPMVIKLFLVVHVIKYSFPGVLHLGNSHLYMKYFFLRFLPKMYRKII